MSFCVNSILTGLEERLGSQLGFLPTTHRCTAHLSCNPSSQLETTFKGDVYFEQFYIERSDTSLGEDEVSLMIFSAVPEGNANLQ